MIHKRAVSNTALSFSALALILTAGIVAAGPLTPPVGSVTSTYKTLTEVEPRIAINAINTPGDANSVYRITQPGSYYLTGNLQGVAGSNGIEIAASHVTVDLMGFEVTGNTSGLNGIVSEGTGLIDICVRHGTVSGWSQVGISFATPATQGYLVEGVHADLNVGGGISVGLRSVVRHCTATSNAADGIKAGSDCQVIGCIASAQSGASDGIETGQDCVISDCIATGNVANGMNIGNSCTVNNSTAISNVGNGISVGNGCTVTNCTSTSNSRGISTGAGCTITNATAISNNSSGISAGVACTISSCTSTANLGIGIEAITGCTVADCVVRTNRLDGIMCAAQCIIRGNTSASNGFNGDGAGIHATANINRIEGNNCTGSDRGIDVDAAGNIIIKNTCSGNTTNWDIVAGNVCLVVQSVAGAAILGNAGGVAPGSTDSNANFTY